MPKRDLFLYINDIHTSCNKIIKYAKGMILAQFKKDEKTCEAIERNLEIIGEAASKLPVKFRKKYKDIPWKLVISMRNKVIHEYFGVDKSILWKTVMEDIPALKKEVLKIKKDFKERSLFD